MLGPVALPMRPLSHINRAVRVSIIRRRGVTVGACCRIGEGVSVELGFGSHRGVIVLGSQCELSRGTVLRAWGGSITLGTNVFVGEYAVIYGHGSITIGDDTLISMHSGSCPHNTRLHLVTAVFAITRTFSVRPPLAETSGLQPE